MMTAVVGPVLIRRGHPEVASKPGAGARAKLYSRIALYVILAFSSCVLTRVGAGLVRPRGLHLSSPTFGKAFAVPTDYPTAAALLALRLHYYHAAASYLSDAIKQYPQNGRNHDRRALAYWKTGQVSLAALDFEQALKIDSKDVTALKDFAWLLSSSSRASGRSSKRAITLAQQACKLTAWQDADAIEALAAAYAADGAFGKAIKTQGQALALRADTSKSAMRLALYAQHKSVPSTATPAPKS